MPFPYYHRLNRRDRAVYRRSDRIDAVELDDPRPLQARAESLAHALADGNRRRVQACAEHLVTELLRRLGAPRVRLRVLATRPSSDEGELHGRYDMMEDGSASIVVWMRTAAQGRIVRFRTFLRTLLHEVCHHLDFTLYGLADSFHTEGFFRRESSLTRQLIGSKVDDSRPSVASKKPAAAQAPSNAEGASGEQLLLPF